MRRARIVLAGAAMVLAGAALTGAETHLRDSSEVTGAASLVPISHGARRGSLLAGGLPGIGHVAVYEPARARAARARVVYILVRRGSPVRLARRLRLAATADQLVWDATVPPFVAVVGEASSQRALARLEATAHAALSVPSKGPVLQASELVRGALARRLTATLQSPAARAASAAAALVIPPRFSLIATGPDGGTVWQGRIPGAAVPRLRRASLVYLPPGVDLERPDALVVLLHGLRGAPSSFAGALRLPEAVDPPIASGRVRPFIAVMPPAGLTAGFDGEWTGPWERYVVDDVVPWASTHLPVLHDAAGRVIAGYSAGGYGAVDIALRHPHLFGVAESWSGYFGAPHDGSLRGAPRAELATHSPTDIVEAEHRELRSTGPRVLLSAGRHERMVLRATRRFGRELARLGLRSRLLVTRGGHDARQWHAVLRPGLAYALPASVTGR